MFNILRCSSSESRKPKVKSYSYLALLLNPSGNKRVNKTNINKKLNSTPFRPPPTTNHPSLKWTIIIPATNIKMVIMHAHLTYFSNSKHPAATTCDNLIAQARNIPKGANPIWFKYKLPKSLIPLLNMPGTLCMNKIIATASRSKKVLLSNIFIGIGFPLLIKTTKALL